jgi:hypothetical protein
MKRFEKRNTEVQGPRTVVRLDVAEASLPALVEGVNVDRVWLEEQGDGTYAWRSRMAEPMNRVLSLDSPGRTC